MIRPLLGALALLAVAAPAASASDAEIFATNNTAVITDPADPRLKDNLKDFARQVERIIDEGGGDARGSQLLDGVFFEGNTTTFERSREFDVDRVSEDELHTIADTIRARFGQQSVLTFDKLPAGSRDVDAVQLDVSGVTASALRTGLLNDAEAAERLFGGSVTQDKHLLLVASLDDADLARKFAKKIGGDIKRAATRYGKRQFVEGPLPVRVERGTLVISGTADDDAIALTRRPGRIEVSLGEATFAFAARKVDRVRVDGGDGTDTFAVGDHRLELRAAGDRVRIGDVDVDGVEIVTATAQELTVGDLSATDVFQVNADADRMTAYGSEDDDQISLGSFGLLGPTFIQLVNPSLDRYLTIDGRGGDDIISSSSAAVDLTLVGGSGDNVLIGGPGDDHLVGGDGFDDVSGGKGDALKLTGKIVVGGTATLTGLPWTVNVSHAEASDQLAIDGRGGKDTLDTSAFTAGTIGVGFTD